jgi:hypothetical protein
MEQKIHSIIQEIFYDLQACCEGVGEDLCTEGLTDAVCDRMHDESAEYRAMVWEKRRAVVRKICRQYI